MRVDVEPNFHNGINKKERKKKSSIHSRIHIHTRVKVIIRYLDSKTALKVDKCPSDGRSALEFQPVNQCQSIVVIGLLRLLLFDSSHLNLIILILSLFIAHCQQRAPGLAFRKFKRLTSVNGFFFINFFFFF